MTYKEFIDNILSSRGRFGLINEYKERHHIIPRCMNGSDDKENLIDLTAEEHFRAHELLAKENPDNLSLQYALVFTIVANKSNPNRYKPTKDEKDYINELNRKINSIKGKNRKLYHHKDTHELKYFMPNNVPEDFILGFPPEYISPMKGHIFTDEHNKKLSISKKDKYKGKKWYNNGINETLDYNQPDGYTIGRLPFTEEIKAHIKEGSKKIDHSLSIEARNKISTKAKGKKVYNNGIISIRAYECPEGFVPGMLLKNKRRCEFYTNGNITKKIYEGDTIPEGFYKGMAKNKNLQDRKWWTNGTINHWSKECPGEGYYLGKCGNYNRNRTSNGKFSKKEII